MTKQLNEKKNDLTHIRSCNYITNRSTFSHFENKEQLTAEWDMNK
jgi:hypothetical protein